MLADRLNELKKQKGCSNRDIAKACNASPVAVLKWLNGDVDHIRSDYAAKLADFFGVNVLWLITGVEPRRGSNIAVDGDTDARDNEYVKVFENRVLFDMGSGIEPSWEEIHDGTFCVYKRSFFRDLGVDPKNCIRVQCVGDSMEPLIHEHDYVLIDTAQRYRVIDGKVYAIAVDNSLRIKRLYKQINKGLVIHSDNPAYHDEIIPAELVDSTVNIIGRVIDRSGSDAFR